MYLGDFVEDETVFVQFTTHDGSGGAVAPSSAFETADIKIYRNNNGVEKASTNGVVMASPFDSITGLHGITIDTSDDTGAAGFWITESDYTVVLDPDETVDGQTVIRVVAHFSIDNRTAPSAADIKTAMEADGGDLSSLMEALVNKRIWRESDGRLEMFNDSNVSQGTIAAQVATDGTFTTAKRALI